MGIIRYLSSKCAQCENFFSTFFNGKHEIVLKSRPVVLDFSTVVFPECT